MRAVKFVTGLLMALSVPSALLFGFFTSTKSSSPYKYFEYFRNVDVHYLCSMFLGIGLCLLAVLVVVFGCILAKEALEKK